MKLPKIKTISLAGVGLIAGATITAVSVTNQARSITVHKTADTSQETATEPTEVQPSQTSTDISTESASQPATSESSSATSSQPKASTPTSTSTEAPAVTTDPAPAPAPKPYVTNVTRSYSDNGTTKTMNCHYDMSDGSSYDKVGGSGPSDYSDPSNGVMSVTWTGVCPAS